MKGIYRTPTKCKLYVYNYGVITLIADFKNNFHDEAQALKMFNNSLIDIYNELPKSIFYFSTYISISKNPVFSVDYKMSNIEDTDRRINLARKAMAEPQTV